MSPLANDEVFRLIVILCVLVGAAWIGMHPSIRMATLLAVTLVAALLLRLPRVWIPGWIVAVAFVPFEIKTGTLSNPNVAVLGVSGLMLLWAIQLFFKREVRVWPNEANVPWTVFLVIAGMSILAGNASWNPWVTVKENFLVVQVAQWAILILSACAFWLMANQAEDRQVLMWASAAVMLLGLIDMGAHVPTLGRFLPKVVNDGPVVRSWAVTLLAGVGLFDLS
jgi:hypothetical protein